MTNPIDGILVASNKSTDRGKALRERAHDEIHIVLQTKMMTNTLAVFAEYSKSMSLVNHDGTIVLVLQFDNLWQFGEVTLHGEYTVSYDKLDGIMRKAL